MFSIIALLPENLVTALEIYRQKYDPQAKVIPPHINVLPSFAVSAGLLQPLYDHLTEVGEVHSPIKISLAGWDTYDQTDYQIRLPVIAGQRELAALRNDLISGPLCDVVDGTQPYCPHIVLGRFSRQDEFKKAQHAFRGFEPQFVFRISHLVLMYRDRPTQPWQQQRRISLEATILSPPRKKKREQTAYEIRW